MTSGFHPFNQARHEYIEAEPANQRYLDKRRADIMSTNGGHMPPGVWPGPAQDPDWPEFERAYLAKQFRIRAESATAVLAVLFATPLSPVVHAALQETLAAAQTRSPDAPEVESLKQLLNPKWRRTK